MNVLEGGERRARVLHKRGMLGSVTIFVVDPPSSRLLSFSLFEIRIFLALSFQVCSVVSLAWPASFFFSLSAKKVGGFRTVRQLQYNVTV